MRYRIFAAALVAAGLSMGLAASAQQPQPDPNPDPNAQGGGAGGNVVVQGQPGAIRMAVVGGPGGGQAFVMPGGGPGMMGRDPLAGIVSSLGELNLAPDFILSADQKNKIQAVRDDFKAVTEAWKKDHEEEINQLEETRKEMFEGLHQGNMPDPGRMMEISDQTRALYDTSPDGQVHIEQIKQILTEDQLKCLEERLAAQDKLMQDIMNRAPIRLNGMGGAGGGAVFVPATGDQTDKEKEEKDKSEKKK